MSIDSSSFIFNVIYVGGTVDMLLPLLTSLIDQTSCKYRLVANGCMDVEIDTLKNFVKSDSRLIYYQLKGDEVKQHHEVLHKLLVLDDDLYFGFIDSDMIAESDFVAQLLTHLETCDAVSTGLPIWHQASDRVMQKKFKIMGGKYVETHSGMTLGVTYCAIYRRDKLKKFIEDSGINFDVYRWDTIPGKAQEILKGLDLKKSYYDTGKVLNILWQENGAKIRCVDVHGLHHIGGISGDSSLTKLSNRIRHFFIVNLPFQLAGVIRSVYNRKFKLSVKESSDICYLIYRRRVIQAFFRNLLTGEDSGKRPRRLSQELVVTLREIANKFNALHASFYKKKWK